MWLFPLVQYLKHPSEHLVWGGKLILVLYVNPWYAKLQYSQRLWQDYLPLRGYAYFFHKDVVSEKIIEKDSVMIPVSTF